MDRQLLRGFAIGIAVAPVSYFLKRALGAWGVLDPLADNLGGWLRGHVSPDQAGWTVGLLVGLVLWGLALLFLNRRDAKARINDSREISVPRPELFFEGFDVQEKGAGRWCISMRFANRSQVTANIAALMFDISYCRDSWTDCFWDGYHTNLERPVWPIGPGGGYTFEEDVVSDDLLALADQSGEPQPVNAFLLVEILYQSPEELMAASDDFTPHMLREGVVLTFILVGGSPPRLTSKFSPEDARDRT